MDIKEIREELGLSQKKFADCVGVSVKTIQSWEQGIRTPGERSKKDISEIVLNVLKNNVYENAIIIEVTGSEKTGKTRKVDFIEKMFRSNKIPVIRPNIHSTIKGIEVAVENHKNSVILLDGFSLDDLA